MVKLGGSNVITIVIQVLICWCLFKQSKGQTYTLSGSSYAVKGESYRFTCNIVGGNLPGALKFTRDNVDYCVILLLDCSANDGIYSCGCVNNNNNTLYLNIPDVKTTDEGEWKCRDNIQGGGVSNIITLPVYYGPGNITLDPGSSIIVREGTSRTVTCSADCKPSCGFMWYKTNTEIVSTSQLILNNRNQAGSYRCEARHLTISTDTLSLDLQVTVYYGPDSVILDPSSIGEVVEGDDMTPVTCSADCKPTCNINWSFSGSSIPTSHGVLQLTNMNRTQHGTYTCNIQNYQMPDLTKSKTLRVTVNYPPIITRLTSNNREVSEGSSVTFTCTSDSRPNSTITWSTSVNTNIASGNIYINPDVSCLDTDNYTCSANNGVGSASSYIPLFVKCSPRLRDGLESEITNRIGQTVTLEVDVLAYPKPTFIWKYNSTGEELNGATIEIKSENNYVSTIKIELELSSFGVYSVLVNNDVGVSMFVIRVIDGDPPQPTAAPVVLNVAAISGGIVAAVLVVTIVIVIIIIYYKRKSPADSNKKRFNLHCFQAKNNSDTAAVTYDVVGPRDVNNYDGLNMTESTDNQTYPVYVNQTTNPDHLSASSALNQISNPPVYVNLSENSQHPPASNRDVINQRVGNEGSNPEHPPASNRDGINQRAGDEVSNPVNTYEHLTTAYTNENSYETF